MSILESINKHNQLRGVEAVLAKLDAAQASDLRTALANPHIGHTAIVRGLRDHGIDVSETSVRRWRDHSSDVNGL